MDRRARRGEESRRRYDPEALVEALLVEALLVEALFDGPKSGLRPIYAELLRLGMDLGEDVKASPCKTFVPLYRKHVFAQIKPSTTSRIDLGLSLGTTEAGKRLIDTGGLVKGYRITHRIPIGALKEIDAEVERWLKRADELDFEMRR